jgi:Family of unknown function (DUF5641)/Integrase core domain
MQPPIAALPSVRTTPAAAFTSVGVDFAGPFTAIHYRKRGHQTQYKAYLCLFVCMFTKAVHLELAQELSTEEFIAVLKRFMHRRGKPTTIYSDNGLNFVGANAKIQREQIQQQCDELSITWKFNPPYAPHTGGLWEAGVKQAKRIISKLVGAQIMTTMEWINLLTKVEAVMNSRPLTLAEDGESLTPAHFLINRRLDMQAAVFKVDNHSARWALINSIQNQLKEEWLKVVAQGLQKITKWKTQGAGLKEGQIVLITEPVLPNGDQLMGQIIKIEVGEDKIARSAILKTKNGETKRSVRQLVLLLD